MRPLGTLLVSWLTQCLLPSQVCLWNWQSLSIKCGIRHESYHDGEGTILSLPLAVSQSLQKA